MKLDFNQKQNIHFIGIGGISMSSLANVLLSRGFKVSGSDQKESELTLELKEKGATIYIGQSAENIKDDIDLVVYTAAIHEDNQELCAAKEKNIPCVVRADFLGSLMQNYKKAICVSGTHGKTTTTSLISQIMLDADTDPTIMVGGILPAIGGNTRIGHSDNFITEACEYTNSFLSFFPTIEVILNVQADHLDFFKDLDDIRNSFKKYTRLLPKDGTLVINGEIENLDYFTEGLECNCLTFGINGDFDFTAKNISYDNFAHASFDFYKANNLVGHVKLNIPGEHNVFNCLAALTCAYSLGINLEVACKSVSNFEGVDRRFQYKGEVNGITIIDDYAHHPDEIKATLNAAKKCPHKKLWVVFQPHTYSRTAALFDDFADALSLADAVVLADIYAAREQNTFGITSKDLQKKLTELGSEAYYFESFEEIEKFLLKNCVNSDLLITLGAGDVYLVGENLLR